MSISPSSIHPYSNLGNPKIPSFVQRCHRHALTSIRSRTINKWLDEMLEKNCSISANEINEEYADLVKHVHIDFYAQISKLIKSEYRRGNDKLKVRQGLKTNLQFLGI